MPGAEVRRWCVHLDPALLVEFDPRRFQAQPVGVGAAADRDEDLVRREFQFFAAAFGREIAAGKAGDFGADLHLEALLEQEAGEGPDDIVVQCSGDLGKKFHDGDVAAQAGPDRAQFQSDGAAADDDQFLRDGVEGDCLIAGDDRRAVELEERQLHRRRTGGDHDVLALDRSLGAGVRRGDLHGAVADESARAGEVVTLRALASWATPPTSLATTASLRFMQRRPGRGRRCPA